MPQAVPSATFTWPATITDVAASPSDASDLTLSLFGPNRRMLPGFPVSVGAIVHDGPSGSGLYHYQWTVPSTVGRYTALWQGHANSDGSAITGGDIVDVVTTLAVYTYDITSDTGRVRLLIDDRDLSNVDASVPLEQRSAIFNDDEIGAFIAMGMGNPLFGIPTAQQSVPGEAYLYGAANALTTIAGNRQLLVQSRRIGRAQVEFGSVRQDLLKQAEQLLEIARNLPADGIAEQALTDFGLRRIIVNTQLRTAP